MTATFPLHALSAALLLASLAAPAAARPPSLVIDCGTRALPSQRAVAAFLGLSNQGRVYAARGRLMAQVARVCRADGTQRVKLVLEPVPSRRPPAVGLAALEYDTP